MHSNALELLRYGVNGSFATAVHYVVLLLAIEYFQVNSAGVANFLASLFGIGLSFIGNRYFVFTQTTKPIFSQAVRFVGTYAGIALLHGFILFLWSDIYRLNYHVGFLIAVLVQFTLGYLLSRNYVFKNADTTTSEFTECPNDYI